MFRSIARRVAFAGLTCVLLSCGEEKPAFSALGVYVETAKDVQPLVYGDEKVDVMTNRVSYPLTGMPPTVNDVKSFVVNLPDAIVSDSKIYAFDSLDRASWYAGGSPSDPEAVPSSTERLPNGAYRLTPTRERIALDMPRYVAIRVIMPMGSSDRLYVVALARPQ